MQALDFFVTKLLYSTRLKINDYIKDYAPRRRDSKFLCEIVPVTDLDFNVSVEYIENSQTILKMEFYAGDRNQAEEMVKKIKKNRETVYGDLYKYIMKIASKSDKDEKEETPKYEDFDDNMSFFE